MKDQIVDISPPEQAIVDTFLCSQLRSRSDLKQKGEMNQPSRLANSPPPDYYGHLHLDRHASEEAIESSFQLMTSYLSPSLDEANDQTNRVWVQVVAAHKVLSNLAARIAFDRLLDARVSDNPLLADPLPSSNSPLGAKAASLLASYPARLDALVVRRADVTGRLEANRQISDHLLGIKVAHEQKVGEEAGFLTLDLVDKAKGRTPPRPLLGPPPDDLPSVPTIDDDERRSRASPLSALRKLKTDSMRDLFRSANKKSDQDDWARLLILEEQLAAAQKDVKACRWKYRSTITDLEEQLECLEKAITVLEAEGKQLSMVIEVGTPASHLSLSAKPLPLVPADPAVTTTSGWWDSSPLTPEKRTLSPRLRRPSFGAKTQPRSPSPQPPLPSWEMQLEALTLGLDREERGSLKKDIRRALAGMTRAEEQALLDDDDDDDDDAGEAPESSARAAARAGGARSTTRRAVRKVVGDVRDVRWDSGVSGGE